MSQIRVAILTNIPAPYRLPVFRELAAHVELQVIFDARSEPNRSWKVSDDLGFRHVYAHGAVLPYERSRTDNGLRSQRYLQLRYNILHYLWKFRPQVVVSAEMGARTLQAEIYCRMAGVPLVIWNEGTAHTEGWVSGRKRRVRKHFVASAARFWTNGSESSALLQSYGAEKERIDNGMMAVDTNLFMVEVDQRYKKDRDSLRSSLGLQGTAFCFVGELGAHKGIHEYLEALRCLRSVSPRPFSALFVGEGPERAMMEKWSLSNAVPLVITGFQQPADLPGFYAAADVFVLPTLEDNWALVTLEAAFAGLPQIFSKFNGATSDLMAAGVPGVIVNPYDISSLTGALQNYVITRPERISHPVRNDIARMYSSRACALRMCTSIERCLNLPGGTVSGSEPASRVISPESMSDAKAFAAR